MKRKKTKKIHRHYRKHLHVVAKAHSVATILFLGFYFSFAFVFGPKILYQDLLEKYDTAKAYVVSSTTQVSVTAYIPGPPGKPIVTTFYGCTNDHKPFVRLDWNATIDTDKYDIYRNGNILSENIITMYYNDNFVQEGQSYKYQVYSKGVRGETASDEKEVSILYCTQNQPLPPIPPQPEPEPSVYEAPQINQLIINGKIINLDTPIMPISKKTRPILSGIATTANAKIRIQIGTKKKTIINLVANNNGYWKSKIFPKKLSKGIHTILITVIHSQDNSLLQSYSLTFRVGKKKWVSSGQPPVAYYKKVNYVFPQRYFAESLYPLKISENTSNRLSGTVYAGKKIKGEIKINDSTIPKENPVLINYKIVDQKGRKIVEETSTQKSSPYSIQIPYSLKEGKYKLVAWYSDANSYFSDERPIEIKELPLLAFGQNTKLTCSNLINYTGWIAAIAFATLVLVSILILIEHHLSKDAPWRLSEDELKRGGLIS